MESVILVCQYCKCAKCAPKRPFIITLKEGDKTYT